MRETRCCGREKTPVRFFMDQLSRKRSVGRFKPLCLGILINFHEVTWNERVRV